MVQIRMHRHTPGPSTYLLIAKKMHYVVYQNFPPVPHIIICICFPMTSYFKGTDNDVNPIHRGINVPKRPFRITINVYGRIEDIHGAFGVLSVFLGIHGGEP